MKASLHFRHYYLPLLFHFISSTLTPIWNSHYTSNITIFVSLHHTLYPYLLPWQSSATSYSTIFHSTSPFSYQFSWKPHSTSNITLIILHFTLLFPSPLPWKPYSTFLLFFSHVLREVDSQLQTNNYLLPCTQEVLHRSISPQNTEFPTIPRHPHEHSLPPSVIPVISSHRHPFPVNTRHTTHLYVVPPHSRRPFPAFPGIPSTHLHKATPADEPQ